MYKVVNIGKVESPDRASYRAPVFCKIQIEAGKLSISGVIGPKANGDARGSAGQIIDEIREAMNAGTIERAKGWTIENTGNDPLAKFINIWDRWHLNDMRASCEHQRAAGWETEAAEKIKVTEWHLLGAVSSQQKEIEERAIKELGENRTAAVSYDEAEILRLPYSLTTYGEDEPDKYTQRAYYTRSKTEEKTRGWISFEDDQRGILSKPCEVCGYKYGNAWKFEELPAAVVEFLEKLPESEITPAWI